MKFPIIFALGLCAVAAATGAAAGPVADALDRAAIPVAAPARATLIGATRAGGRIVAAGERGIVALSDDDGRTWRQAVVPSSVTLTAVRFADPVHGWAIGHGGLVLVTNDKGEHWTRLLDGRQSARIILEAARRADDANAVKDAERLVAEGPDKPLLDLVVSGENRLLVVGAYGVALASEDGGKAWASWMPRLPNPKGLHIYAARQRGNTIVLAGEQGLLMFSQDAGKTFRRVAAPYQGSFFAVEFLGDQDIVLAGLRGNALRTTDGGNTWTAIASPMPASITGLALDGEGRLLAVNQAGFVLKMEGDSFVPVTERPLPPLNGVIPGRGELVTLTVQGVAQVPVKGRGAK